MIAPTMSAKSTETIGVTTIRVFSRCCSEYMPARRWRLDSLLPSSAFWFLMSATVPPLLLSCHGERDLLDGRVLAGVRAHDLALEEDRDAVGELQHLVEVGGDEKDRAPSVALGDDLVVDELRGSNVQAARGVDRHEELGVGVELTGEDDLLLVAAGQRARRLVDGRAADVVLLTQALGVVVNGAELEPRAVAGREAVGRGLLEHEILGDGHVAHEAHLVAVLGDVA